MLRAMLLLDPTSPLGGLESSMMMSKSLDRRRGPSAMLPLVPVPCKSTRTSQYLRQSPSHLRLRHLEHRRLRRHNHHLHLLLLWTGLPSLWAMG